MDGIKEYDDYVTDKKLFRKKIRECNNVDELVEFLSRIAESNTTFNCNFTYKLKCKNPWSITFEDIAIEKTGAITGYFYLQGTRNYKNIKDFSYKVYLVKENKWSRSFGIMVY